MNSNLVMMFIGNFVIGILCGKHHLGALDAFLWGGLWALLITIIRSFERPRG